MPWIDTSTLKPNEPVPYQRQVYCALDTCITAEVLEALETLFTEPPKIYSFSRALQGPFLEMALRGFKINEYERAKNLEHLEARKVSLQSMLDEFASAVWGKGLNPNSSKQVKDFFLGALRLPEIWTSKKGERKLSFDREALEKYDVYLYARPIVQTILALRDTNKTLSTLRTSVSPAGRWMTSFNIAGTSTGRISSSKSSEGFGANLQNIKRDDDLGENEISLRKMFEADPGYILVSSDREQAESREVGFLCGLLFSDWSYLDACESSDLHTLVTKYTWTDLAWTGDPTRDRKIAEQLFYRNNSYRDMAKKLGHGSSYGGKPHTMAKHAKCPQKLVEDFQRKFFTSFSGIPRMHRWVAQQIQTSGELTNLFGRTRRFFGRTQTDETLREAIAYIPQSSTADRTNLGLWLTWYELREQVQLLAQVHDSITYQVKIDAPIDEIISKQLELCEVYLTAPNGRRFTVPGDVKIGYNWGRYDEKYNPNGLRKYKKGQALPRRVPTAELVF